MIVACARACVENANDGVRECVFVRARERVCACLARGMVVYVSVR